MKKTAILLMLITIISKIFGFAREIALSYFYGTSNISDAYLISQTIPLAIFSFIGTAITTGYIPLFNEVEQKYGEKESNRFTNNLVNLLFILCTIIVILGLLFTERLVKLFASGFEGETLALAVQFTKITIIGIYFTGILSIFGGFLRIKGNYIVPALIGFPMNFFIILSIFLSKKTNILVLAIGSVVATISQLVLLMPFIYKEGYRYKFVLDIKDKYIKKMLYLVLPVVIGVSVNQINTLVDKTIASRLSVGGISALNYSFRLIGFVQGLFVATISTVMYPMISKMAVEDDIAGLKSLVSEAINSISLLVIPCTVGAMLFSEPVVKFLFGRGAFDSEAISLTSNALFFYSIGMIGFGLRDILSRAFYSLQDTKTPMINGILGVITNIILNLVLSKFMGIGGLALATSISAIFSTILLFISFRKKIGSFGIKNIIISSTKIICASLIMGIAAKLLYSFLLNYISANLSLIAAIILGAIVYFILIYFMGIEEVDSMINAVKNKLKRSSENA